MGVQKGPFGLPRIDAETRRRAIEDPGPTWREWFFYDFLKVWVALGFLIVDSWVATVWLDPFDPYGMAASLLVALYLEILAYRYLWYRPGEAGRSTRYVFVPLWSTRARGGRAGEVAERSRRNWFTPRPFGRWTPEADRVRLGLAPFEGESTAPPDAGEFL